MAAERDIPKIREDGLQLEEHRTFQERFWKVERIAWVFYGLIVVASLVGLTGSGGMLAAASQQQGDSQIDYPRVSRWQTSDMITLRLAPGGAERRITFSDSFFEQFQLEAVQPQTTDVIGQGGKQTLVIKAEDKQPILVQLHLRPIHPGIADYAIAIDNAAPSALTTVILP
ncbi:hypothetical protein ACFOEZ_16770 [Tianweitania populi]|uniref:Uncharacterized protein n=1 Tax=Tianweitania populi TaxID=1607949 RepID=A0A8J3GK07_9HYPH|nr:hypothetical protein [Tianweitania populi]GHD15051.1 hypothetical protein GCM10016234_21290 [Tianweitania populi]